MKRMAVVATTIVLGFVVTACAGQDPSSGPAQVRTAVSPSSAVPTSSKCDIRDLGLKVYGSYAQLGMRVVELQLVNRSGARCNASGFPPFMLMDDRGRERPVTIAKEGTLLGDPTVDPSVPLAPGFAVDFTLQWHLSGATCSLVASVALRGQRPLSFGPERRCFPLCGTTVHEASVYKPTFAAS